jgi:hypothetical protein
MFGHYLHKIKHGTSPVIHGNKEVVHASTGTVVLATPEVVAPTPSVAVPSTLEMAAILGVVEAIFDNKKRVAMELKCSDSVTRGGRKAGKFISGPSRVVISYKWMKR